MIAASDAVRRAQAARVIAEQVELSPDAVDAYTELLVRGAGERAVSIAPEVEAELTSAGLAGRAADALVALPVSQAYRRARARAKERDARLRASVTEFRARYADRFEHVAGVTVLEAGDPTVAFVGSLFANARTEVLALERGDTERGFFAEGAASSVARLRERGVRVRTVVRSTAIADAAAQRRAAASIDAGAEVRQHSDMPLSLLVIDGARAVIDLADPDTADAAPQAPVRARGGDGMTMLYTEAPEMVAVFERTFASFWSDSTALATAERDRSGDDEEQVIALLSRGLTDEAIAGRLGVSPKTISRRVSVLMAEFRVHTRLQLGAELSRRGLC